MQVDQSSGLGAHHAARTMPTVFAALDVMLRRLGGAPTYVLTDNEKTVTVEHVAGIAVRNPQMVAFARHYAITVHTCAPADPASKAGRNRR
jgi:transposase